METLRSSLIGFYVDFSYLFWVAFFNYATVNCPRLTIFTLFGPHWGGSPSTSFQVCDSCPSLNCADVWLLLLNELLPRVICPCFLFVATGTPVDDDPLLAISSMSTDWPLGGLWFSWSLLVSCACLGNKWNKINIFVWFGKQCQRVLYKCSIWYSDMKQLGEDSTVIMDFLFVFFFVTPNIITLSHLSTGRQLRWKVS